MANSDLRSVLPTSVTVVFPRADSGVVGSSVYTRTVTLASLEIPEYAGFSGFSGTHVIRSTALANFTGGGDPTNVTELTALANAIARDFYRYQAARVDLRLIGVPPWEQSGLDDHFEITYRLDDLSTRIQRPAWNEIIEELPIAGSAGSSTVINVFNDPVTFNNTITVNGTANFYGQVNFLESVVFQQFFRFPTTNVSISTTQNNYNLTETTVVLKVNATSDFDFTGFDNGEAGRFLWIENEIGSTGVISLKHQSSSSSAGNQIVTPDLGDYYIFPGQKVALDYNASDGYWYIVGTHRWYRRTLITINVPTHNLVIPPGIQIFKLNVTANTSLTGIAKPNPEVPYQLFVENRPSSTNNLTIEHNSGSSSAGNRIWSDTGANVLLTPGQSVILLYDPDDDVWIMIGRTNGAGTGVTLAVPENEFSVSGSGTSSLTISKDNQNANTVWAGPTSGGAAAPTFRLLTAADIPATTRPEWYKFTFTHEDLTASSMTQTGIVIRTNGAREVVHAAIMKTTTAFSGGGATSLSIQLGVGSAFLTSAYDAFATPGDTNFRFGFADNGGIGNQLSFASGIQVKVDATADVNVVDFNAGSMDIYLLISVLP